MGDRRQQLVSDLLHAARVLHDAGCLPATDGNFSARLDHARVLLTTRGIEKRRLSETDITDVSLSDEAPERGSTEWGLHRAIYLARSDVNCVLHVHAPALMSFAAAHRVPSIELLAEAYMTVGQIALVPFVTPGTPDLGARAVQVNRDAMVYLLANHGAVAVGSSITETLFRLERAEFLAQVEVNAHALGSPRPLNAAQLANLKRG